MSEQPSAIRRIVTTHDAKGTAVVLSDGIATNVRTRKESGDRLDAALDDQLDARDILQ